MTKKYILHIKITLIIGCLSIASSVTASAQVINTLVNPPCSNSVCIDDVMNDVAHHEEVVLDPLESFYMEIHHAVPCGEPRLTGVTVHKQIAAAIAPFPDTVCINQGCTPSEPPFRSGTGPGGVTTPPRECR